MKDKKEATTDRAQKENPTTKHRFPTNAPWQMPIRRYGDMRLEDTGKPVKAVKQEAKRQKKPLT